MSDLISRQAAIDAVSKYNFDYPQYMERFVTELMDAMKADLKHDIEALPSAQPEQIVRDIATIIENEKDMRVILKNTGPEQRWIPCSERMPNHDEYIKNNGLFNVSDGNRSYSEWFDFYEKKRFGEPTMSGFRVDYAVTAWMPLPEPYRVEEKHD